MSLIVTVTFAILLSISQSGFGSTIDPKECLRHIPVCGSDGVTYDNVCFFLIQKHEVDDRLHLDHYGPCRYQDDRGNSSCEEFCTKQWDPVCGDDGETYANECLYDAARCRDPRLRLDHRGACDEGKRRG